jgi:hypothetical protein
MAMTRGALIVGGVIVIVLLFALPRAAAQRTAHKKHQARAKQTVRRRVPIITVTGSARPGSLQAIKANAAKYASVRRFLRSQAKLMGISVNALEQGLSRVPIAVHNHLGAVGGLKRAIASTQISGDLGTGKGNPGPNGSFATYSGDSYSGGFGSDFDGFGGEGSV